MPLYLEDLAPGMSVTSGPVTVTEQDIIAFARQFDPQPFHTDPVAAKNTFFGTLVASGWHTSSLAMRLLAQSSLNEITNGLVGLEIRNMRWPRPTFPGDTLMLTVEVKEVTPSRSRPGWGTALLRWTMRNQRGETAMELDNVAWIAGRTAAASGT